MKQTRRLRHWPLAAAVLFAAALAVQAAEHGRAPHWGYSGKQSPDRWASLSDDFALCGTGRSQSPVDLSTSLKLPTAAASFRYKKTPLKIVNNGHTIQVNYAPGSYAELGGTRYELMQFHFHSPSEHTIDGKHSDMEAHLVHRDSRGNLAVVGVLLAKGHALDGLKEVWKNLPQHEGEQTIDGAWVDVSSLLPKHTEVYSYSGSLTTPPCSEGVSWFVMVEPVDVSTDQIQAFQSIISPNARPVQPLNARGVLAVNR